MLVLKSIFFAEEAVNVELYSDFGQLSDIADSKPPQMTGGIKIKTPILDVKTANCPGKYNFGLMLKSPPLMKSFPFELLYGNLSAGGPLSKLNSPELSRGSSPFNNSIISATALTASLPGYTSFSKEESSFCQLKLKPPVKNPLLFTFGLWLSPENQSPLYSFFISQSLFNRSFSMAASFTTGRFFYEENSSSSWTLPSPYYPEGSHLCSLAQLSADYKSKSGKLKLAAGFMAGIYESPYGPFTAIYRAELKAAIKNTEILTAAFLNPYEDTLTSSGKKLDPLCQLKAGIVSKKPFLWAGSRLIFIKLGLNTSSDFYLTKQEHPFKVNSGIQLSSELYSLSFCISSSNNMYCKSPDSPPQTIKKDSLLFQIKTSCYFKSLIPSLSFSLEKKFESENEKRITEAGETLKGPVKYKLQLNISNTAPFKLSGNAGLSFTAKESSIIEKKISTELTCTFKLKHLSIIGKASASFSL